ncbi:hypothetical protein ASF22_19865 [Methylobacterium sp. Leaf87]|uniref:hypothetical protein n=1 Tax=Methylobacterium sp. Leaf87 TaxID=1736243 RepID=UPI0006F2A129|nr:hypothetical protein [Methylobacterium sp. Leaf87]KQO68508.1 hypothetical protein ASF22_19865 [Methylobacterium sp. Leaf87]
MPENLPPTKHIPYIDPAKEPVVFLVHRYRPEGAKDAEIQFGEITVAELATHPIFVAADMTKITRRRILEHVASVREIRADRMPVVGLHIVLAPGKNDTVLSYALAKVKIAVFAKAISLFENGEYRLDMDPSRERALIRMLEVLGIPEAPEDRDHDAEASAATLAP